jgi:hypothetical protein
MDVINISLGVSGGWEEEILAVMADRLVSQGVNGNVMGSEVEDFMYIKLCSILCVNSCCR